MDILHVHQTLRRDLIFLKFYIATLTPIPIYAYLQRMPKAKFHYVIWSQTGSKLVADLQRAGIWPII